MLSFIGQIHKGVSGLILDSVTNAPVSGAVIQIDGIDKNVTSFVDGDYWRLLTPGKYVVRVSHREFESQSREVEVFEGAASVADFKLESKGKLIDDFRLGILVGKNKETLFFEALF